MVPNSIENVLNDDDLVGKVMTHNVDSAHNTYNLVVTCLCWLLVLCTQFGVDAKQLLN